MFSKPDSLFWYLSVCFLLDVKEQAVDREHERDFFQQEIQKLEQQLKNQQKQQAGSEHRNQEVMGKKKTFFKYFFHISLL